MMQIFVDMDGVCADFDTGYELAFGVRPDKKDDNVDWDKVRNTKDFYLNLPAMPDFEELWSYIEPFKPIVLTGVPWSVEEAPANKRAWWDARKPGTEVRCCLSKEKALHCLPGDVLIDDWEKYRDLWIAAGGHWITHTSASNTIRQLMAVQRWAGEAR